MKLLIRPFSLEVKNIYNSHDHFHEGDAGLDLFIIHDQTVKGGESAFIHLQIACENLDTKPYLLMPLHSQPEGPPYRCAAQAFRP